MIKESKKGEQQNQGLIFECDFRILQQKQFSGENADGKEESDEENEPVIEPGIPRPREGLVMNAPRARDDPPPNVDAKSNVKNMCGVVSRMFLENSNSENDFSSYFLDQFLFMCLLIFGFFLIIYMFAIDHYINELKKWDCFFLVVFEFEFETFC